MSETPQSIVAYWFSAPVRPLWFKSTKAFDNQLRERFEMSLGALRIPLQASSIAGRRTPKARWR